MNCSKYLWPMVFASVIAGCSFTGGNAPITDGSATASVYTVKPGDTLYAISSRYGLDPAVVARENHLTNPSHLLVGQNLFRADSADMPQGVHQNLLLHGHLSMGLEMLHGAALSLIHI